MRRVSRMMVAMAVVCALAVPAMAAEVTKERQKPSMVKTIKKLVVRAFGDLLTTPKP